MINSKFQRARIEIIDRELNRRERVKTKDLLYIINEELSIPFSLRTIQKDIQLMREGHPIGYDAPIEIDKKKKAYYYTEKFSIKDFGLREEHFNALLFYSKTLHNYKDYKIFNSISEAIEKILDNYKISPELKKMVQSRKIVQTEKYPPIKGHEFIELIIDALEYNRIIEFDYCPFKKSQSHRAISPVLLREDKHMWYVLGCPEGKDEVRTFALDRMKNLVITKKTSTSKMFNEDSYFKHSFGITVFNQKPDEIILSFSTSQGHYLKALPIHETQRIIIDNDQELRISLTVIPSYEFYSKILSYGSDVKVLSPKKIVKEVKKQLLDAYSSYKSKEKIF